MLLPHPLLLILLLLCAASPAWGQRRPDGQLELEFVETKTQTPLPVRIELRNAAGRPVPLRGIGTAPHAQHFYADGTLTLPLRAGGYTFAMDAGIEYRTQAGHFEIERHADDTKRVEVERFADLADEGWYAGDIDVARPCRGLDVAQAAEGLWYVPLVAYTWSGTQWEQFEQVAGNEFPPPRDGRILERTVVDVTLAGGRLLCVAPSELTSAPEWKPTTTLGTIRAARAAGYRVLAASPVEWEYPLWLAEGQLDGVVLWSDYADRRGRLPDHQRPADRVLFAGPTGTGRWHEAVYFHTLNAGLRLPPLAGSHTGANDLPLGSAKVYVHCSERLTSASWWQSVLAGASVVSTGPLLRPLVGGDPPGQVFSVSPNSPVAFEIALNLATRTPVDYFEVLRNGEVEHEVRLADWAAAGGKLPPITFDQSGWFALRAVTTERSRYDVALSAPYYVDDGSGPRVAQASCDFFLTWLDELVQRDAADADAIAKAKAWWTSRSQ